MKITDVDVEVVSVARKFGNVSAVKAVDESTFAILRLTADDGTSGVGEISDIEDPETIPDSDAMESKIENFLLGEDPRNVNRLTAEMNEAVDFGPFAFHSFQQLALAGIDTALYDLVGNYYDTPVYQLLGGRTQDVPVCWVVYTRQEADALESLRTEVQTRVEQGFSAFKLKVGEVDPGVDVERIRAVREIAGESADVFVDVQGVWTVDEAIQNIELFEEVGIDGVETPVGHPDTSVSAAGHYYDIPLLPSEIATVRDEIHTPVFEHVHDPAFAFDLIEESAVDVFTVEVCAGGISRAEKILSIAEGANVDARLGSTGELGPGTLAAGALGAASTGITYPCDLAGPRIYADTVLESGLEYTDGRLRPKERPGFGFEIREEIFE